MNVKFNNAIEFKNIKELMNYSIEKYSKNNAFIVKHKEEKNVNYENITYERLGKEINALGTAFLNMGFKDKRIAVIGKNRYEWMLSFISVINGTGVVVPLDKGLPEGEIENSLKISKSDVIIFEKEYIESIKKLMTNKELNLKYFICMDDIEEDGILNLKDLINDGIKQVDSGDRSYIDASIDSEKMSVLLFTSGTTSASKAVMLCHRNLASNLYGLNCSETIYSTDINMAFLPFHHTFGSMAVLLVLNNGGANVFCDGIRHIQENLREYKVTMFVCVPLIIESMYKKIMATIEKQGKMKKVQLGLKITKFLRKFHIDIRKKVFKEISDNLGGHLRFIVSGASGIDRKVAESFNDFGFLTVQGYGLTETSPVVAVGSNKYNKK